MSADAVGLTTARLSLRRFTPDDREWFLRVDADPDVKRHMGGVPPREASERMFQERILDYYAANPGYGIWVTLERSSGARVGFHLLNNIRGEKDIQVGYVLDKPYWGRGYATEMCVALLGYGFGPLSLPRICAITALDNVASQRVLLKSGLHRHGERRFAAYEGVQAYFERDRHDWLAQFGGADGVGMPPAERAAGKGSGR